MPLALRIETWKLRHDGRVGQLPLERAVAASSRMTRAETSSRRCSSRSDRRKQMDAAARTDQILRGGFRRTS
jgi:hypothetical protein